MIAFGHRLARHSHRIGCAAIALAFVAGCTAPTAYKENTATAELLRQARQQLLSDLQACSARYNYDPDEPGLPEDRLAPYELQWRSCAYDAARDYTQVNTAMAIDFATLIDQDKALTADLAAGEITRSERRLRLKALIENVHQKEVEQLESLETDAARDLELIHQVGDGLRGLR